MALARPSTVVVLGARVDVVDVYVAIAIAVVVLAFAVDLTGWDQAPSIAAAVAAAAAGWLVVGWVADRVRQRVPDR